MKWVKRGIESHTLTSTELLPYSKAGSYKLSSDKARVRWYWTTVIMECSLFTALEKRRGEKRRMEKGESICQMRTLIKEWVMGKCVSSAAARREVSMNTRDTGSLQLLLKLSLILERRLAFW